VTGLALPAGAAEPDNAAEYKLKAAVLLNLARVTEWPTNAFTNAEAPFVIGLVGQNPFGPLLDDTVRGQTVHGRPVVVRRLAASEALAGHLLFLSRSETPRLSQGLRALPASGVLTVSDMDRFAERGGMVALVLKDGLVRLHVNLSATERRGLKISSKVLKYATLVPPVAGQQTPPL
jgi:hypothetical protein